MSFRRVELPEQVSGALWLSSMPGRFGSWRDFVDEARETQLALVVCLTPLSEVEELSPTYHAALARGGTDFEWLCLPMPNFGLPDDKLQFREGVMRIAGALRSGQAVMLHCAAGLGRTGSTAACVLKALGVEADEALERVRQAGSNPQNAQQAGFVKWF